MSLHHGPATIIEQALTSVPRCPICSAYLVNGPCDTDGMTTAEIARLIWDLEMIEAVNSGLDWGRTRAEDRENIAQLNKHIDVRLKEQAHA